jgi:hypothetical protein
MAAPQSRLRQTTRVGLTPPKAICEPVYVKGTPMSTLSDERMAKFKVAINQCRDGDLSALCDIEIALAEMITINALAKATGDTFTYGLTKRLLTSMKIGRVGRH